MLRLKNWNFYESSDPLIPPSTFVNSLALPFMPRFVGSRWNVGQKYILFIPQMVRLSSLPMSVYAPTLLGVVFLARGGGTDYVTGGIQKLPKGFPLRKEETFLLTQRKIVPFFTQEGWNLGEASSPRSIFKNFQSWEPPESWKFFKSRHLSRLFCVPFEVKKKDFFQSLREYRDMLFVQYGEFSYEGLFPLFHQRELRWFWSRNKQKAEEQKEQEEDEDILVHPIKLREHFTMRQFLRRSLPYQRSLPDQRLSRKPWLAPLGKLEKYYFQPSLASYENSPFELVCHFQRFFLQNGVFFFETNLTSTAGSSVIWQRLKDGRQLLRRGEQHRTTYEKLLRRIKVFKKSPVRQTFMYETWGRCWDWRLYILGHTASPLRESTSDSPDDPAFWYFGGPILLKNRRLNESYPAYPKQWSTRVSSYWCYLRGYIRQVGVVRWSSPRQWFRGLGIGFSGPTPPQASSWGEGFWGQKEWKKTFQKYKKVSTLLYFSPLVEKTMNKNRQARGSIKATLWDSLERQAGGVLQLHLVHLEAKAQAKSRGFLSREPLPVFTRSRFNLYGTKGRRVGRHRESLYSIKENNGEPQVIKGNQGYGSTVDSTVDQTRAKVSTFTPQARVLGSLFTSMEQIKAEFTQNEYRLSQRARSLAKTMGCMTFVPREGSRRGLEGLTRSQEHGDKAWAYVQKCKWVQLAPSFLVNKLFGRAQALQGIETQKGVVTTEIRPRFRVDEEVLEEVLRFFGRKRWVENAEVRRGLSLHSGEMSRVLLLGRICSI